MMAPLASIIIPVYNVEKFLERCLASVCAQTYARLEIILVDDGSADASGQICDRFSEKDPRIQVIHQKNEGVSAARNKGLEAAKGKYIYFVDGDDWVDDTMVEETVFVMEAGGYDACTWGHYIVQDEGGSLYFGRKKTMLFRFSTEEEKRHFLCRWLLSCRLDWSVWSRVFRRDVIEHNRIRFAANQKIFEDLDFSFRYLACCQNLYYIPRPFYHYRQHSTSALHANTLERWTTDTLEMTRRQESMLAGQSLFEPFFIYTGTVLTVLLDNFVTKGEAGQGLAQAVNCFEACKDWEYLKEQAQRAAENRTAVRRACGWRLGGQVNGFFQYILTRDAVPYQRAYRVQCCYTAIRTLKNKWFCGRRGGV